MGGVHESRRRLEASELDSDWKGLFDFELVLGGVVDEPSFLGKTALKYRHDLVLDHGLDLRFGLEPISQELRHLLRLQLLLK